MKQPILFFICLAVSISSLTFGISRAELITVSGDVYGIWSADTVMVIGEIRVPAGQTLQIQPGVQVRFTGRFKFFVQGRLTAQGTPTDSILFTRAYPTEESKWRGFRFDSADNRSTLDYCRIEFARGDEGYPDVRGGGIWVNDCSPTIRRCRILYNYSRNGNLNGMGAGICLNQNCFSIVESCHILLNESDSGGGIAVGSGSNVVIRNNRIEYNQALSSGGGIYVSAAAEASIYDNDIRFNSAMGWGGGGITLWSATWLYGTSSRVYGNLIIHNSATNAGGGIYSRYDASMFFKNTLAHNQAATGGGFYVLTFSNLPPTFHSSIFWGNIASTGSQIHLDPTTGSTANIAYCDVQNGWTGTGNLNLNPEFVNIAENDFRLEWGSPCIDAGVPAEQYNDPDGTRSDVGYHYFDQSKPVRILLTLHDAPVQIPSGGGSFDFNLQWTNIDSVSHPVTTWCYVTNPSGSLYYVTAGPQTMTLNPGAIVNRLRTQSVPERAPAGTYLCYAKAVVGADTSTDSFLFSKQGSAYAIDDCAEGWTCRETGADENPSVRIESPPLGYSLDHNFPDPFNSETMFPLTLPQRSRVLIELYDLLGRKAMTVFEGECGAGKVLICLNASPLAAGIYFYRLEALGLENADRFLSSDKLVLLK